MDDLELESWRAQWQSAALPPQDLRGRVERETRMMRRFVAGEVAITLLFGGGSIAWAVSSRRTDVLVLAIGIWAFIAIAWTISFLLRRDAWSPATLTTAAFLDLSILRCRRRREAIVAQAILYALILTFDLAWIYAARPARTSGDVWAFLASGSLAWVWAVTAALGIAAVRHRRRLSRELETLMRLRASLDDDAGELQGVEPWASRSRSMKRVGRTKRRDGLSAGN